MRVFLDTNVLVAAFATRGLCEDVLLTMLSEHDLIIGTHVLAESEPQWVTAPSTDGSG